MMQTSIKEIVEGIKNVAQVYFTDEIKFVSFNQFPTASFDKNCIGLIYYIDSYPSSVNTSKVSIRFEFLDLINTMTDIDESKLEAFSDTQGVGEGFVQYLDRNGYRIDEAVTKTKIEPKTNNGVGGTEFIVTFNYLKDCFITGDGYKFKALTIGKTIDSDSNFLVNIADVTENNSGLTGLFKFASTPDSDLNVTINEAKTQLTIQTDVGTTRFSNLNFTASNGIVDSSAVIVNSIAFTTIQLLLDQYPNAGFAYSYRLIRELYSGNSIKVRTGGSELDIGYNLGVLNTSSLLTFTGSGDGFLPVEYDQSLNGNNLTQTTAANQLKIVDAGSLITSNSLPASQGSSSGGSVSSSIAFSTMSEFWFFEAIDIIDNTSTQVLYESSVSISSGVGAFLIFITAGELYIANRITGSSGMTNRYSIGTGRQLITIRMIAGVERSLYTEVWINDTQVSISNSSGSGTSIFTDQVLYRNARAGVSLGFNGKRQESIFYPSVQSANRVGIQTNIKNYYTLY
jgi:hypothetical protein